MKEHSSGAGNGPVACVREHVERGVALAKRRPLLFAAAWIVKTTVVYVLLTMHHGDGGASKPLPAKGIDKPPPLAQGDADPSTLLTSQRDAMVAPERRPFATIVTSLGNILLQLLPDDAPKTVANFMDLAQRGFFNKTHLYRYEKNFVLQGGGWPTKSSPLPPVPLEYKVPNAKYFVSTARTADPNSATCEYSIMLNDNAKWLGPGGSDPYGYAVFARVVEGFDVIDKFASLNTKVSGLTLLDPPVIVHSWTISYSSMTFP